MPIIKTRISVSDQITPFLERKAKPIGTIVYDHPHVPLKPKPHQLITFTYFMRESFRKPPYERNQGMGKKPRGAKMNK
jgi:hypothetical protein